MSMPYPQDRHCDRKEKGEQPYKDDREALNEMEAELHRQAATRDGFDAAESEEDRQARQEAAATERLAEVGDEVAREREAS